MALIEATSPSAASAIVSIRAPAAESVASARSNARATVASRPSRTTVLGTAKRQAASGRRSSRTLRAASTSCTTTASRTERVIAETVSSVVESGTAPSVGTRRAVPLKPTTPWSAAGMRIEPPVSEPSATQAAPVATDAAPPDVEPPGMRGVGSSASVAGLASTGKCGLRPTPENANSDMWVRPTKAAPAARRRATAGQSTRAGGAPRRIVEPAAVTSPATSNRSLSETARPASGPGSRPAATAWSAAAAAARAASRLVATNAGAAAGLAAAAIARSTSSVADAARATIRRRTSVRSSAIAMLESSALPRADEQPGRIGLQVEDQALGTWKPLHPRTGSLKVSRRRSNERSCAAIRAGF